MDITLCTAARSERHLQPDPTAKSPQIRKNGVIAGLCLNPIRGVARHWVLAWLSERAESAVHHKRGMCHETPARPCVRHGMRSIPRAASGSSIFPECSLNRPDRMCRVPPVAWHCRGPDKPRCSFSHPTLRTASQDKSLPWPAGEFRGSLRGRGTESYDIYLRMRKLARPFKQTLDCGGAARHNELIATPPLGVEIVRLISILARPVHQVPET